MTDMEMRNLTKGLDDINTAVFELSKNSGAARKIVQSERVWGEILLTGLDQSEPEDLYDGSPTFHPDGRSGCILMNDEYFLDIRCDHLMWMDGWLEPNDLILADGACDKIEEIEDSGYNAEIPAVLIVGNHKGCLYVRLLYGVVKGEKAEDFEDQEG